MANRFLNNIRINDEYTLPAADGSADQIITTDGSGQLSFVDQSTINAGNAEHVVIYAKNTHTAQITKGTPVYITGTVGATDTVAIAPADASNSAKMPAVGILDDTLAVNAFGYVITGGFMDNITTSPIDGATPSSNDTVYVKAGGGLTLTKPTGASNLIQNIAKVGKVSGGNSGSLIVSSILRTNDVPNLTTGKIWVGTATNTAESGVVHLDEGNGRMGINANSPLRDLHVVGNFAVNAGTNQYYGVYIPGSGEGSDPNIIIGDWHNASATLKWDSSARSLNIDTQYSTGAGTFNITGNDGASTFLTINSSGNVGIGTTSPQYKLDVDGDVQINETLIAKAGADLILQARSSQVVGINSNGTRTMTLDASNNVGIGTTSPEAKLQVEGNIRVHGGTGGKGSQLDFGDDYRRLTYTTDDTMSLQSPESVVIMIDNNNNSGVDYFAIKKDALDPSSGTELFRVQENGNVGIGTTSPSAKLTVNSGSSDEVIRLDHGSATGNPYISFYQNGTRRGFIQQHDSSNRMNVASEYGPIALKTGTGGAETTKIEIATNGAIQFNSYGSGTFTGTTAYNLAIDSSGNIIENSANTRSVFVATSTDTTTNINATTTIQWNSEDIKDSGYTHSDATNPDQITITQAGTYKIYAAITYTTSVQRANIALQILVNSVSTGARGAGGYVRSASGHNDGTTIVEDYVTLSANDVVKIQTSQEAAAGTVNLLSGESKIIIEKLTGLTLSTTDANTLGGLGAADFVQVSGDTMTGQLEIALASNQLKLSTGTAGDGYLNIGHFSNGTFIGTYGDDGGAADIIRFGTHSGDERMRIASGGNVGIGTTSPVNGGNTAKWLTLNGQSGSPYSGGIVYTINDSAKAYHYVQDTFLIHQGQSGIGHRFFANGSEKMRITSGGNVGIGATNPGAKLDVVGDVKIGSFGTNTAELAFGTTIANKVFAYGAEFQTQNSDIQVVLGRNNGTSVQGTGGIGASSTNAFHVYDTTSVTKLFEVAQTSGNATFSGDLTVSGGDITLGGTGRIQGVDTVSAGTDAANKTYVDNAVTGLTEYVAVAGDTMTGTLTLTHSTFGQALILNRNHASNAPSITFKNTSGQAGILYATYADTTLRWRDGTTTNSHEIWHEGNDGAGSGLDADLLDGQQGSYYLDYNNFTNTPASGVTSVSSGDGIALTGTSAAPVVNIDYTGTDNAILTATDGSGNTIGTSAKIWYSDDATIAHANVSDLPFASSSHNHDSDYVNVTGDTMTGDLTLTGSHPKVILDSSGHVNLELDRASSSYDANLLFKTAGAIKWRIWNDGSDDTLGIRDEANATEMVTFKTGGNVGIGETNPSAKLEVRDSSTQPGLLITSDGGNEQFKIQRYSNNNEQLILGFHSSDYAQIQAVEQGVSYRKLALNPNGGYVGIGTTDPGQNLEVSGQGNTAIRLTSTDSATSTLQFADSDDANVGVIQYDHTNNYMLFRTNDGERMRIASNGDVGIGETNPEAKLHVNGIIRVSGDSAGTGQNPLIQLYNTDTSLGTNQVLGTIDFYQSDPSGGGAGVVGRIRSINDSSFKGEASLTFSTGESGVSFQERMRITSEGDVGIGTDSPVNKLNVNGDIGYIGVIGQGSIYGNTGNSSYANMQLYNPATGYSTFNNQSYGYYFNTSGGTKLTILNNGNVGIGTTSPSEKLQLKGDSTYISVIASDGSNGARLGADSSGDGVLQLYSDAGVNNIKLYGEAASPSYINAGNVGIGTTSPSEKLVVNGPIVWQGSLVSSKTSSGALDRSGNDLRIRAYGATAGTGNLVFRTGGGGGSVDSEAMRITSSGNVGIGVSPADRNVLDIKSNDTNGVFVTHRNDEGFFLNRTYADYNNDGATVEYQERVGVDGNYTRIGNFSNHPLYLMANNDSKISILTNGNVGIGKTNPSAPLNVFSSSVTDIAIFENNASSIALKVGDSSNTNYANYVLTTNSGNAQIFKAGSAYSGFGGAASLNIYNSNGAIAFHPNGNSNSVFINTSGKVGIGTTSPGSELEVDGETTTTNLSYPYPSGDGQYNGEIVTFGSFNTANGTIAEGDVIVYTTAGLQTGWMRAQGNTTYSKGMLGIAMGTSASDGILIKGFARNTAFASGGLGSPLYLSPTSAGDTTNTIPSSTNNIVRIVGYMLNPTNDEIFFDPDKSWVQVSS